MKTDYMVRVGREVYTVELYNKRYARLVLPTDGGLLGGAKVGVFLVPRGGVFRLRRGDLVIRGKK